MGRRPKQTFLQRRHTDGQEAHEKLLNITNYYFFFLLFFLNLFIIYFYFWLHWVFVAVCGLLTAVASVVAEHGL